MTIEDGLLSWLGDRQIRVVCFDFGGTLYDFEPVHASSFLEALDLRATSPSGRRVRELVSRYLKAGLDSVMMAHEIIDELNLGISPIDLAVRKRVVVERLTRDAQLSGRAASVLRRVASEWRTSVITRGLKNSTSQIVDGCLPLELSGHVPVYGRHDMTSRPDKRLLLVEAFSHHSESAPFSACCYIGDSDDDERISTEVGALFYRAELF